MSMISTLYQLMIEISVKYGLHSMKIYWKIPTRYKHFLFKENKKLTACLSVTFFV